MDYHDARRVGHPLQLTTRPHADCTADAAPKKAGKKGSKPSAYNEYMKVQLAKLKADQEKSGQKSEHKENFKKVAQMWANAPENPKNKK